MLAFFYECFYNSAIDEMKGAAVREFAKPFKALSDPNRIRILKMLENRPLCVCEIQAVLNLAASTVSKHLAILRDAGFIYDEKEQKWVNYHLNPTSSNEIVNQLLHLIRHVNSNDPQVIQDREQVKSVDRNVLCSI